MLSQVAQRHRAEERVPDGVRQSVAVGMRPKPLVVRQRDAAQVQREARLQTVDVVADPDPVSTHHPSTRGVKSQASSMLRSPGSVSLRLDGSPGTTATPWPMRSTSMASSVARAPSSIAAA